MKKDEFNYFVGIDVSKLTLDLVFISQEHPNQPEHICLANNQQGMRSLSKWVKGFGLEWNAVLFCMEYTGEYTRVVQRYLIKQHAYIWMEMPIRILRSIGLQRGKNDKVDACRIAQYACRHQADKVRWNPPAEEQVFIKDLLNLRRRLINAKKMLLTPIKEMQSMNEKQRAQKIKSLCSKPIKDIENQIIEVEEQIRELLCQVSEVKKNVALMTSIPGIGTWIALEMICATDNFTKINKSKQLACYCGCAPFEHRSGTSVRGKTRVSHMANKTLKSLLTMGAISLLRSKNEIAEYYTRKVAEGKNKMVVVNAVRNKLIHRIIAVIDRQTPYQKELC